MKKDYSDFVERMGSFDMELDDPQETNKKNTLKHSDEIFKPGIIKRGKDFVRNQLKRK